MRLKTMEKIDEGKDKKHTGKPTDIPEDGTLILSSDVTRAQAGHAHCHAAVLNKRYPRLPKRRFIVIHIVFNE